MSFAQWNVYKQDPSMSVALDPISPIVGSDSLYIHRNGTSFTRANVCPGATITHGFTFGRMRSLFKFPNGGSGDFFGFGMMLNQENLSGTSGVAYGVIYRLGTGVLGDRVDIVQFTAGLGTFTAMGVTGSFYDLVRPAGLVVAVDVTWRLDLAIYGGVVFQVQVGELTTYADLTTRINYVDTSSPLTATVNEALVFNGDGSTAFGVRYDQTFHVPRVAGS